jgi:hypothetical protein
MRCLVPCLALLLWTSVSVLLPLKRQTAIVTTVCSVLMDLPEDDEHSVHDCIVQRGEVKIGDVGYNAKAERVEVEWEAGYLHAVMLREFARR